MNLTIVEGRLEEKEWSSFGTLENTQNIERKHWVVLKWTEKWEDVYSHENNMQSRETVKTREEAYEQNRKRRLRNLNSEKKQRKNLTR